MVPTLSIVVPAFNEADTIRDSVAALEASLAATDLGFEIIVVSDGSADGTAARARSTDNPRVRVIDYERNMGKGWALRTGSRAARGEWIAWFDADLDLRPEAIVGFLDAARTEGADIVIGSKRHPGSSVEYPTRRRVYSWMYQQLVRALFHLNVRDTQVGMKLFRREALDAVLPVVLVKRYAFDLEVLAVARRFGFGTIIELPVTLKYRFSGTGMNWGAIANAVLDTLAVFYRLRVLRFYDRKRQLMRRMSEYDGRPTPRLTVAIASGAIAEESIRANSPPGTEILTIDPPGPGAYGRVKWLADVHQRASNDVVALLEPGMSVNHGWGDAAVALFRDPRVGLVAGPTVPLLDQSPRHDAAAVLSESRFGVGGARVRSHVGALKEINDFPARNIILRRAELGAALNRGLTSPDELCRAVRSQPGRSVVVSPDVIALAPSPPLFAPYLRELWATGRDRGRRLGRRHRVQLHHLAPLLLLLILVASVPAILAGGVWAIAATLGISVYGLAIVAYAGVIALLHRSIPLGALAAMGAAASHVVFGAALLVGVVTRWTRRRPAGTTAQPRPSGPGD